MDLHTPVNLIGTTLKMVVVEEREEQVLCKWIKPADGTQYSHWFPRNLIVPNAPRERVSFSKLQKKRREVHSG